MVPHLACPICRSVDLVQSAELVECRSCGLPCPVVGGVPVMFDDASVVAGPPTDEQVVRGILDAFRLPSDAISLLRLRQTTRRHVRFGGSLIRTESAQFVDRVRSSGHGIATAEGEPMASGGAEVSETAVPRIVWHCDHLPRRVPPGVDLLANVRFENAGSGVLCRDGTHRAVVAVGWRHDNGWPADVEDLRTPLPVDLAPGQALTVAVKFRTPSRPGLYLQTLTLVQEQLRWLDAYDRTILVRVEDGTEPSVPEGWIDLTVPPESYDSDHDRGLEMLSEWMRHRRPQGRRARILEVGGNVTPMASRLPAPIDAEVFNVDVDLLGLQVGVLHARANRHRVHHVCADAGNLPFPDRLFDAAVVFASLHHFPDPGALLAHLATKLVPGGFVGVLCEPVGHVWPGAILPEFLRELEKGVNEQSFSLREYDRMFRRAGLVAAEATNDFNSLKARLVSAHAVEA